MKYSEQRIPTLNEYCVVCDEQHVFQNGSMLKVMRKMSEMAYYTMLHHIRQQHMLDIFHSYLQNDDSIASYSNSLKV